MQYLDLTGVWKNEFGSIMTITSCNPTTGLFLGTYKSDTGATGVYNVAGYTDISPDPCINSQTVSFSVSWRNIGTDIQTNQANSTGEGTNSENWVSAFSGQVQVVYGGPITMTTTYLLQKNTDPSENWDSTVVAPSTFKKQGVYPPNDLNSSEKKNLIEKSLPKIIDGNTQGNGQSIYFQLQLGKLSDNGATPWTTIIGLGKPEQKLKYMIDTGTDNTWITSNQCTTTACLAHSRFDASKSSTFQVIDPTPTIKNFGPWGNMTVIIGEDYFTLVLALSTGKPQLFISEHMNFELAINYCGTQFEQLAADGGIAIPSPYWTGSGTSESLLLQLIRDRVISYPLVSFYTNPKTGTGECYFGAINPSKYNASTLQWLPLQNLGTSPLNYLWSIDLTNFLVNNNPVQAGITNFVLDTGSSFFKGPQNLIDILINAVTNNGTLPIVVNSYEQLNNYPTITLQIGNQSYILTPQQYFLQYGEKYWKLGIEVLDGMPDGMLLVGSLFLDTVYSIFNYYSKCLGLARLNN